MKHHIGTVFIALAFIGLFFIAGCMGNSTTMGVAQARPPRANASLQPTVEAAQVEQYLQAVQAQQTLAVIAAQQTAVAIVDYQHATATAAAREQISWSATATAEAVRATATAEADRAAAYAEARREAATATAEAVRATATAEADRALLGQQLTITAEAWAFNAQATAVALSATATAEASRARREALAAKEAEMTYPLRAYGPWVGLVISFILLIIGGVRIFKLREVRWSAVPRDPNGDAPILVLPTLDGGHAVIDPDLNLGPVIVVKHNVSRPAMGPDDHLLEVAKAAKAVDALTRPVLAEARHNAEAAKAQARAMGKAARKGDRNAITQAVQMLRALRSASPRRTTAAPRRPSPAKRRAQALRTARDLMGGPRPAPAPRPAPPSYRIVPPRGAPRRWVEEVEAKALEESEEAFDE